MTAEVNSGLEKLKRERVIEEENSEPMLVEELSEEAEDPVSKRRIIRSYYREIEHRIHEEKDELTNANSKKFMAIMNEVENMHQHVTKPREQVADAEALLGLASTLAASVKIHSTGSITPAQFVSSLIRQFGQQKSMIGASADAPNISWNHIGSFVSSIFRNGPGCTTMIGPMRNELKLRKVTTRTRHSKPLGRARPEELEETAEVPSDTNKNMQVMFAILVKADEDKEEVMLENLILNRNCFAQTVENLFALSFLVKDGRARIKVDENGTHYVVPKNGPTAGQIKSGDAKHHHFLFRLDFGDWKLMKNHVGEGKAFMPQRNACTNTGLSQPKAKPVYDKVFMPEETITYDSQMPVKKLSRNYSRMVQSSSLTEVGDGSDLNWNCKRRRSLNDRISRLTMV